MISNAKMNFTSTEMPSARAHDPAKALMGIAALDYVMPGDPITAEDWCKRMGRPPETALSIRKHGGEFVYKSDRPAAELACEAVGRLADAGDLNPNHVGVLIFAHTTQYSVPKMPGNICGMIAQRFGLARAFGFSVSEQNCVSLFTAIRIASALLRKSPLLGEALIVSADVLIDDSLREVDGVGLFSDGASALILRPGAPRNKILGIATDSDGAFSTGIFSDQRPERRLQETQKLFLTAELLVKSVLASSELKLADVHRLLPHNLDAQLWSKLARFLKLDRKKIFFENFASKGHSFCNDLVINLKTLKNNEIHQGFGEEKILCFARGYGWNHGVILIDR